MGNKLSLSASDRINALLDDASFVEVGAYVTSRSTDFNMQNNDTPKDGVITGYGVIGDKIVYVYSQDASVLGGAIGEMHAKKIAKIYDMAMKVGAPVIGLVDCAGLRLQEATDALNAFGEVYLKQVLASGVVPQITAIFGTCGGGCALIPTLTDFTFMTSDRSKLVCIILTAFNLCIRFSFLGGAGGSTEKVSQRSESLGRVKWRKRGSQFQNPF